MNILIFTSDDRGAVNDYNIGELLNARPNHTYVFLVVTRKNAPNKISKWNRLKRLLVRIRDGKNYWSKYLQSYESKINELKKTYELSGFQVEYVNEINSVASQRIISNYRPDIIFQAGAGILKENIYSIANIATINVHHGLAPEIRGMKSTFWCLYFGLTDLIGVTCHVIDKTLDTGNIIERYNYSYQKGNTLEEIEIHLCIKGAELLVKSIDKLSKQNLLEESSEVKSYYFGYLHYKLYTELLKSDFLPVKSYKNLPFKIKKRVFLKEED